MPQKVNVLYPVDFVEKASTPVTNTGRNFNEARRLIGLAVVDAQLSYDQIVPLIIGRPSKSGGRQFKVGVDTMDDIRAALTGKVDGITASEDTSSLRYPEVLIACDDVAAERAASWTFLGNAQADPIEHG